MSSPLSDAQLAAYHADGYVIVRNYFSAEEIDLLQRAAKEDQEMGAHAFGKDDGEGGTVRLALWNQPGDAIYGMFARCRRLADAAEQILEDEAYHYHSKMIMKDARTGGAWAWHQDYGYWYQNGVLSPKLVSVMVAVDPATRENGCLQVLRRSHTYGRIDHILTGDQAGADMERVEQIATREELVYCEMAPGDALFLHSNLLHRSDQNRSEHPRWTLICCYNARSNDPYKVTHHPNYTPLEKVADSAILEVGLKRFAESSDVAWMDPDEDVSHTSLEE
jgi:ectoine hydroxylase